jgi:glycerophosphoryl diester phosphodiesterase
MADHRESTGGRPWTIAHRGVTSVAHENSLAAFRAAVDNAALGCTGVELDIHSTADGEIMVHHDPNLADGRRIAELDRAAVAAARLPDGSPIPTLDEALEAIGPLVAWIEAKGLAASADDRLIGLLRDRDRLDRDQIHAFDHRIVARIARHPKAPGVGVLSSSYPIDPVAAVLDAGARTLWQEWSLIDRALVEGCRAAGIAVIAWTVPPTEAERLTGLGVAGLCLNL